MEQFLLADEERETLARLCLEHVAGRVPVIVTCSHFCTDIAVQRAHGASELGAAMIMLMPPYHGATLKGSEQGTYEQFARISDAAGIPIMVQDAPLSGVDLSISFLVKLATEIEQVRYFKIETPMTADKLRALVKAGGDAPQQLQQSHRGLLFRGGRLDRPRAIGVVAKLHSDPGPDVRLQIGLPPLHFRRSAWVG